MSKYVVNGQEESGLTERDVKELREEIQELRQALFRLKPYLRHSSHHCNKYHCHCGLGASFDSHTNSLFFEDGFFNAPKDRTIQRQLQ